MSLLSPLLALAAPLSLFDGTTLDGWRGDPQVWSVRDGAITGEIAEGSRLEHNAFLFHEGGAFADFTLELEVRISGGTQANSGVQIRSQPHGTTEAKGYQADLDDGTRGFGRLYEEQGRGLIGERGATTTIAPDGTRHVHTWAAADDLGARVRPHDWNHYRILAVGPRVELWVNGDLFLILEDHQRGAKAPARTGRLALQTHSGPGPARVQFRNLRLTEHAQASVPAAPSAHSATAAEPSEHDGLTPPGRNLDFEAGDLRGWTAVGDAWRDQPIRGDTVHPRRADMRSQHAGDWWLGGYEKHQDAPTGTLTSASFVITHPWASFRVGGGKSPRTRVELVTVPGGRVLFKASGQDREDLARVVADLSAHQGQSIAVRVVDESSGGWGHVNFDDFRFHSRRPAAAKATAPTGRLEKSPVLRHLQPNPGTDAAPGHRAAELLKAMHVPPGFRVELLAAEPDLVQPIAFCFDTRGRLWVVEGVSYPQRRREEDAADRVLIFEDTDGDGRYETRKVFLDRQNLVSGLAVGFGGVFLGAAPHLLFVPDRDGDDVPDGPAEVLLDGWGLQDTHETLNSFLWGPDGWLYGNQGVFVHSKVGRPGAPDAERLELRAGIWRLHPVTRTFEIFAHGGSNPWGLDYDAQGRFLMTHCRSAWGRGPTTLVVRGGHYWNQSNQHHAPFIYGGPSGFTARQDPPFQNFLLSAARYDHGEGGAGVPGMNEIYGGHSHVGTLVYQGDQWPVGYRGQLLTHNLHGRQINRQTLHPRGSGLRAVHAGTDPLFVSDPTFMGVTLLSAPDGSVVFSDWSDTQHCHHSQVEKWDRGNGALYRMVWAPTWRPRVENLSVRDDAALLDLLDHPNGWHQRSARQLLQERAAAGALRSETRAALAARAGASLSHLWVAAAAGVFPGAADFRPYFAATDPATRAWAITLATQISAAETETLAADLAHRAREEPHPAVRLAVASALPRLSAEAAWAVAGALGARPEDAEDDLLPGLIWTGLAPHTRGAEARALDLALAVRLPLLRDSLIWYAAREAAGRDALAARLAAAPTAEAARWVELLALALEGRGRHAPPAGWPEARAALVARAPAGIDGPLERVDLLFGDAPAFARLRARVVNRQAGDKAREAAFKVLAEQADPASAETFMALLDDPAFRVRAAPLVGRLGDAEAAAALVARLGEAKGEWQAALANALSSRPVMARALLDAVAEGRLPRTALTALQARQIVNLKDDALRARLESVWGRVRSSEGETRAAAERLTRRYQSAPAASLKVKEGRAVYDRVCAVCHALDGQGGNLGPDLGGTWRNGLPYFIESIVDPNAVVGEAFQMNVFTLKDGTVVSGMASPTVDGFSVQGPAGPPVAVRTEDVAGREVLEQSMMPPGLLESLPGEEALHLLKFLTTAP
jgi:putative membrane-bound dehydrogenase-like protein